MAVNDIDNWLREHYGIACQSNHPLGGLVNTTPLAGKAGMGWQGIKNVSGLGQIRPVLIVINVIPQFNITLGCSICMKVCP